MTPDEIAAMPRELRDAGSEGQTLKDAWETCERSADLIEDLIAQLATERQARARLQEALRHIADYISEPEASPTVNSLRGDLKFVQNRARAALTVQP